MADDKSTTNVLEKRKKGSKKSKKGWRKATDIADVEEHLEDIRREERTGGVISDKKDEELFFVEKKLENDGESKDLSGPRKAKTNVTKTEESSDEEEYVPKKDKLKMKRKKEILEELKQQSKMPKVSNDAWTKQIEEPKNIWLQDTFKKTPKKPKTVGEKHSTIPAVEVCKSGASYNPDYDSHQELLQQALDRETKFLKDKEKLDNKIKFLSQEEYKKNPSWLDEMSEGLDGKSQEKEKPEKTAEQDDEIVLPKTVLSIDRKTKKQRRKEKERTEEERAKENEKLNNVRLNDVYRLKTLKREIKSDDLEKGLKLIAKEKIKKSKMNEPKRLGKQKFVKPKVVYQLSEEISGSLRGLKPEGDLFLDRLKSLEKRNIIEPRRRVLPRRKYKLKEVEKRSYKKPTVKDFSSKT